MSRKRASAGSSRLPSAGCPDQGSKRTPSAIKAKRRSGVRGRHLEHGGPRSGFRPGAPSRGGSRPAGRPKSGATVAAGSRATAMSQLCTACSERPGTEQARGVQLPAEGGDPEARELGGVEALEATHQAFVGGGALGGLRVWREGVPALPDWQHGVAPRSLATTQPGIEHQLEELRLAADVGEDLGHRPLGGVRAAGQLASVRERSTSAARRSCERRTVTTRTAGSGAAATPPTARPPAPRPAPAPAPPGCAAAPP